ncbi:hypothetical protein [Cysteiniphilum marinum]|uniref:hypothetical protein n=1 Tax=Cysteiniphilum marinum TaxID=2774191 RepID=UPI00193B9729|nr:hypothetical protein [Cysteiniphilum marinum]
MKKSLVGLGLMVGFSFALADSQQSIGPLLLDSNGNIIEKQEYSIKDAQRDNEYAMMKLKGKDMLSNYANNISNLFWMEAVLKEQPDILKTGYMKAVPYSTIAESNVRFDFFKNALNYYTYNQFKEKFKEKYPDSKAYNYVMSLDNKSYAKKLNDLDIFLNHVKQEPLDAQGQKQWQEDASAYIAEMRKKKSATRGQGASCLIKWNVYGNTGIRNKCGNYFKWTGQLRFYANGKTLRLSGNIGGYSTTQTTPYKTAFNNADVINLDGN